MKMLELEWVVLFIFNLTKENEEKKMNKLRRKTTKKFNLWLEAFYCIIFELKK